MRNLGTFLVVVWCIAVVQSEVKDNQTSEGHGTDQETTGNMVSVTKSIDAMPSVVLNLAP